MKAFLLCIFAVWPCLSVSQNPPWRLATGSSGIPIWDIDVYHSNPDTVYAYGEQFLLSTDRGEHWTVVNSGTPINSFIAVDPLDSKTIYLSASDLDFYGNDVLKTTDGGLNWDTLFVGVCLPCWPLVEIDPVDLTTVYASAGFRMLRSTNKGLTWDTLATSGYSLQSFAIAPSNNNILYAAHSDAIYKSTDRGNSWTTLNLGFAFQTRVLLAVHPYNADIVYATLFSYGSPPGGVYKTTDGGLNWFPVNNGLTSDDWDIHTIVIDKKYPNDLFVGCSTSSDTQDSLGLFMSTDSGNNWIPFCNGLPGGVGTIILDTLSNRVYASSGRDSTSGVYILDSTITSIDNEKRYSRSFVLSQNYPNPFNATTTISYTLTGNYFVRLTVYDVLGRRVRTLVNEFQQAGVQKAEFNAEGLPSGVYFYRLTAGGQSLVQKALFIK